MADNFFGQAPKGITGFCPDKRSVTVTDGFTWFGVCSRNGKIARKSRRMLVFAVFGGVVISKYRYYASHNS
jgi:hypothetical protein